MASWTGVSSEAEHRAKLVLTITEISTNPGANQSTVSYSLVYSDNNASYGGYGTSAWSATILGNSYSGNVTFDFSTATSYTLVSTSAVVTHNTDGSLTVSGSGNVVANSPVGATSVSGSVALTNFVRLPTTPGTPTITTRTAAGQITATTTGSTFYGSGGYYVWQWSTDDFATATTVAGGTATNTFTTGNTTDAIKVRVQAVDSEGSGSFSTSSAAKGGVPTAPSSITPTRTGRNVAVVVGTATSSDGTTPTYYVSYSANGGAYGGTVTATGSPLTANFNGLPPATTYTFAAYASNTIGAGASITSSSVFVPAGGKRYDGATWSSANIARRFDGAVWVDLAISKRWDGTSWVDLT